MSTARGSAPLPGGFGRIAAYYVLLGVGLWLGVRAIPALRDAVAGGRLEELAREDVFAQAVPPVGTVVGGGTWDSALLAAISMLGALALMIPVTWIYTITRRRRGYDESVVHTLLILPVAVTGIVMIVQASVALAFSLAGIVAAVRFRTTLEDTKDAVYVFLAIGVGVASGVQALGVALALSVVFNIVILVLWWSRFGNVYADHGAGSIARGDAAAGPGSAATALRVGDPAILEAAALDELADVAERSSRVERYVREERKRRKAERANALITVHAPAAEQAQTFVEGVLEGLATRSKLIEIGPGPAGFVLDYVVRLDDEGVQGAVMDGLAAAPEGVLTGAELRSLKGLKPTA